MASSQQIPNNDAPRKGEVTPCAEVPYKSPKAINWYEARPFQENLATLGWHTPDTYDVWCDLPTDEPAVYLFFVYGCEPKYGTPDFERAFVGYVGMSKRLKRRWACHPTLREIDRQSPYLQRWFLRTDVGELRAKERALIEEFDPPWNIQGRSKGVNIS